MNRAIRHYAMLNCLLLGLGIVALPVQAAAVHKPGMILTVSPGPDTAPNNPCATSLSGDVLKGSCGLRAAVDAANAYLARFLSQHPPTTNPLVLINVKAGTYDLTHGSLVVNAAADSTATKPGYLYGLVKIEGAGSATTIIDGSGNTGQSNGPVMTVLAPADVGGVTVRKGDDSGGIGLDEGGGFYVAARFSLHDAVVTKNSGGYGGGFYITGPAHFTMRNVVISDNVTAVDGGGISSQSSGTLTNVTVRNNISCSRFAYPAASPFNASDKPDPRNPCVGDGLGGGIATGAPLQVTNSTITGNVAGFESPLSGDSFAYAGGIDNESSLVLNNTSVDGNTGGRYGGGIANRAGTTTPSLIVNGGAISGNTAGIFGGGIYVPSGNTVLNGVKIDSNTAGGRIVCTLPTQEPSTAACSFATGSRGPNHTTLPTVKKCASQSCQVFDGAGGGIISSGDVVVNGGAITGNRAVGESDLISCQGGRGGGITSLDTGFLSTSGNLTMSGNGAICGGAIYTQTPADLEDTIISRNYAFLDGGGLAIFTPFPSNSMPPISVTLEGVTITSNTASEATGGLFDQFFSDFWEDDTTSITNNKGPNGDKCPNVQVPCS